MGKTLWSGNSATDKRRQAPCACDLSSNGSWTETVVDIIKKLLPTPAPPPLQAVPIRPDRDLLIQQLMEAICPPTPVAQERSPATDLETLLLNWILIQPFVVAGCRRVVPSSSRDVGESFHLHSQRTAWRRCSSTAPHLFSLTYGRGLRLQSTATRWLHCCDLIMELVGSWCFALNLTVDLCLWMLRT